MLKCRVIVDSAAEDISSYFDTLLFWCQLRDLIFAHRLGSVVLDSVSRRHQKCS
jgi:hypothetical protein